MNSPGPPVRGANVRERLRRAARLLLDGLSKSLELLERAGQLFRVTLLKCLPLATVAVLCSDVPNLYWRMSGHDEVRTLPADATYWALYLIAAGLTLYLSSAVMLQQRSTALGVPYGTRVALATAVQRLPILLLSWVLAQLSLLVGFSLLLAPGVFLLVCYLVLLPVVLFERHNPYLALVRCVLLVQPQWWKMFAVLIITLLMFVVGAVAVGAVLNVLAALLVGQGPLFEALISAGLLAIGALALAFLSALALTLHSALASSSA